MLEHQNNKIDSPIFAREKDQERVSRKFVTKTINKTLEQLSNQSNGKFTSHSFRHGYINDLWEQTCDIALVQQQIGHSKLETTNRYLQNLTSEQLAQKMELID